MHNNNWDIILAGSGLSGLTLALECARRPSFRDKKILLIDRDAKTKNDRTWCFWATDAEVATLPPVVFNTWDRCLFFGANFEDTLDIAPYRYRMVRGLDFYNWAKKELEKSPHIRRITANITGLQPETGTVLTDQGNFSGQWVFNSALTKIPLLPEASALYPNPPLSTLPPSPIPNTSSPIPHFTHLLQHFKGYLIETPDPVFDPGVMTFMDYRLDQKGETRFVYVLPFSENRALVEFTVFSPALCPAEVYDTELNRYIRAFLKIDTFHIEEEEFGVIPMSDYPFTPIAEGRVIHIGTAGGFVKASSGYAFKRTQRKLRTFAADWEQTGLPNPALLRSAWRYRFYDSVMLRVLKDNAVSGKAFFTGLFQKLPAALVLRFLDEDSTFADDIQLLSAPPTWPFFKTALKQMPVLSRI
ncbi:MAG TPA: lycopene cyclase family protein [Saprospiraceae bacterium]|nr:lycopene cyclase family protein [Saprospiraceae bacterium]